MPNITILTDATVQFPQPNFPGQNFVKVVPFDIQINGQVFPCNESFKVKNLPKFASNELKPQLLSPTPEKFRQIFQKASQNFDEIIGIFSSSHLCSCYTNAQNALSSMGENNRVILVDSQSIATGLGYLVQLASGALVEGIASTQIERMVCSLIPHIYISFCISGLSYLYYSGFLDQAQANIGEMLDLLPTFTIEEGKLTPLEKMRNHRHVADFFQEFLDEFDELEHISLIQSTPSNVQIARLLRDHLKNNFLETPFTEHRINLPLATLFGPRSLGIMAIESSK